MGISLRHSGHFLVLGCVGLSSRRILAVSAFMGSTTAKYTAQAMMTKETTELTKSPKRNLLPRIVKLIDEKSGCLTTAAIKGVSRPLTIEFTTLPKAAPITTPTARSTTLPRSKNCLNPFIVGLRHLNLSDYHTRVSLSGEVPKGRLRFQPRRTETKLANKPCFWPAAKSS